MLLSLLSDRFLWSFTLWNRFLACSMKRLGFIEAFQDSSAWFIAWALSTAESLDSPSLIWIAFWKRRNTWISKSCCSYSHLVQLMVSCSGTITGDNIMIEIWICEESAQAENYIFLMPTPLNFSNVAVSILFTQSQHVSVPHPKIATKIFECHMNKLLRCGKMYIHLQLYKYIFIYAEHFILLHTAWWGSREERLMFVSVPVLWVN